MGRFLVKKQFMAGIPKQEIKLFYCYARKDKPLRDELEIHLGWVKRRYQLTTWYDREILPGEEWEQVIDKNLNTAHLILLLITPDFMNSDYCFSKEMQRALERHKEGTCRVIPVLLRPTYWEDAPFSNLQLLPTNTKSITSWPNPDEAFQDVVTEISRTIKDLLIFLKAKEKWYLEGDTLSELASHEEGLAARVHYKEALVAFEQAIQIDPSFAYAYLRKGDVLLYGLESYEEALVAFEQAIQIDPKFAHAIVEKGRTLICLERQEEALATYEQAIQIDSKFEYAYMCKGGLLASLKRHEEAKMIFAIADQLRKRNR